ncbi:MAG: 16S rRNA (adenine(1518)-N(6)/adenine(1519)-N(6))-dimethyltransferase RsmA [Candidatus Pacebacteria bacterium]|jgi:16S rRNA (adenine1518-N6/adenine1519-N6)-dimethyltransferase|nr:16S rRNA (adenine(1518)-N(6)/adenine(1519)-N(6))-dimethyltransferase RsmA [Candidatus Paceibacterota bacterium]
MKHIRPKKSLGQNFLKSHTALTQIIAAGKLNKKDVVLEIGPGKGALTEKLLEHAGTVIAIEKDTNLFVYLSEKFSDEIQEGTFILLNDDILDFSFSNYKIRETKYKLIANIPYNITGAILRKFLSLETQPEKMVLLVQKEVAERIVARDRKESILSISVKAYGTPKYIAKVPARYFSPAPKVDSAIISIENISKAHFASIKEESHFFELLRAGFAHKRKLLTSNLSHLGINTKTVLIECSISTQARAENLTLKHWICLSKKL